ncbi:MAG TPA: glycosyltransferase family 1 protein [Ktedonobacterales bacterium]|nr:glycosyltransferase family 1 protein [Ktedonobacterales bacterium]
MHVAINAQLVSFSATYRNAGVSRYTYRLVEGLSRDEGETAANDQHYSVFVTGPDRAAVASFDNDRLKLVASRWTSSNPARRIVWEQARLPGLLRQMGVDVFHSPVNVLPLRVPCASVVTIHDLAFIHYPQYFRRARRLYQRIFTTRSARMATLVIAVSRSTQRDLITRLGINPDSTRVVYPAIDACFQPVDAARLAAFRQEHDLPPHFVLYLGTLEPRKNVEGLVAAYGQLRALWPDAPPLVLAGAKGWYYDTLFAQVRTLGLERAVTFAGYVSDVEQPLWYAAADLFVYPSFFEGFGLPVAEAMACGVPVITSNVSSLPEVAGQVAIQVSPNDPDQLAAAMRRVLENGELARRMAHDGPRWASQFSGERMVRGCRDVYAEAAGLAAGRHLVEVG